VLGIECRLLLSTLVLVDVIYGHLPDAQISQCQYLFVRRLQESVPAQQHFAWLSKPALVTDPTTGRNGNVHAVALDRPGPVSWKPTSGSPPMLLGTWPVIVNFRGGGATSRRRSSGPVDKMAVQ